MDLSLGEAALAELRALHSLSLLSFFVVITLVTLVLAPAGPLRLKWASLWLALHLSLAAAASTLQATGLGGYALAHRTAQTLLAFCLVALTSTLLFSVLLPRLRVQSPRIVREVLSAAAYALILMVMAAQMGVNVSGIIATSTVITAVIGLALQDTLGNVMAGLALQIDGSVEAGDWIQVGDKSGRVLDVGWRSTRVETRNWETLVVPNSALVRNTFTILGRRDEKPVLLRRWVYFGVDYRFPPADVIETVNEAVRAAPIPCVASDPLPQCVLMDFHESYGSYALRYWLNDLAVDDPTDSAVRTRIYFALNRASIPLSIPAHAIFVTEESSERKAIKAEEELKRRIDALNHVDLFDHLPEGDRNRLAAGLRPAPFSKGEIMTRQGAEAHWLYLMISGEASARVTVSGGGEQEAGRLKAGNFFGEMSLMTGARRNATVVALTDVECYRLDKASFQSIMSAQPELAEKVAEVLARRRMELDTVVHELDEEALRHRLAAAQSDILGKIRHFFGLSD
ncbi:MAG: mechanosensitive ion channel family protein [Vicinamibacteria bacterium]